MIDEAVIILAHFARLHYLIKPWVHRFPVSDMKDWHWKDVIIEPPEWRSVKGLKESW